MSNLTSTVFYIGVTNNLDRRVNEHRCGEGGKFTSKYKLYYLVYFEEIVGFEKAIGREKQLKRWHRDWKINLIKSVNPEMKNLF